MDEDEADRALDDAVGPFYDAAGLQSWLELREEQVLDLIRDGHILAVRTLDGDVLFPSFQFGPNGDFLPRLNEVFIALRSTLDEWSIAQWLLYEEPPRAISYAGRLRAGETHAVIRDAIRQAEILRH
ncbi:hypothetical protein [Cryobacterium sp. PAMC25264]|uniref:hypothetical protein n=1 Tax=Cryobacterium sp. PAMC25264 TaxID=2861288 RepID=UPI001C628138|nr:hypothetical protein [Cryobacterium sp. PAMC25264]QYF74751.1 hypothetical protein KY500_06195 [Cryobacterium sp. PAMC25264]